MGRTAQTRGQDGADPPGASLRARILIAEPLGGDAVETLTEDGFEVLFNPHLGEETLAGAIRDLDPDVLIVRSCRVGEQALGAGRQLALVVRSGAGVSNIDVPAASARGILVSHCPGKGAIAVAELAWGLILACDRRIPEQVAGLRAGKWDRAEYLGSRGLCGRTLGIVGLGAVGQEIARRGRAFGMHVIAWSRNITESRCSALGIDLCSNLVNLAKLSDVVSVSVAGDESTHHLVGEKFFAALREGSILVNTSRGTVIDEAALAKAIAERGVRAALDVFAAQPEEDAGTLRSPPPPGAYLTHRVGAWTMQAAEAVAAETVRIVRTWSQHGRAPNCVNLSSGTNALAALSIRHHNRPGALAGVLRILADAGLNVEEMDNSMCAGGEAAIARIHVSPTPDAPILAAVRALPHVLSASIAHP